MKRILKLVLGTMALTLGACSNDLPGVEGTEPSLEGKNAYMMINIVSATDGTRATNDEGFQYGDAGEHAVHDAQFFFFDKEGRFVTKATVWTGGSDGTDPEKKDNIEYFGKNVIVLKNLTSTPVRYLLTVLNLPDFEPSTTIEATATKLQNWQNRIGETNYHVMSTASYFGTNDHHNSTYPYATFIQEGDYQVQPQDVNFSADNLNTDVVDIYVERLAAKVEVKLDPDFTSGENPVKLDDDTVLYPIRASVGGYNNGTLDDVEGDDTGAEMLYVKFTGWGLNGILPESSLFKQLDKDWERTAPPFDGWNDPANFRSYWTKTPYYTQDPTTWLSYVSFEEATSRIGDETYKAGVNYCNGNTNTLEAIFNGQALVHSKVTHVLVAAQICNKAGEALDLVRATSGEMYTKKSYINYIFSLVNPLVYVKNDDQTQTQITPDDLDLEIERDPQGQIRVAVKGVKNNRTLYNNSGEVINNPADYLYGGFNTAQSALSPEAYTGGAMYYTIPIEHMGALNANSDVKPYATLGYYGVVRNFWYVITLKNLSRFGHGVFSPAEKIIPDAPEEDNYLLGAKINILSWKVLNQSVNM